MFVIGKKSDSSLYFISGKYYTKEPTDQEIATSFGISLDDYSILRISNGSDECSCLSESKCDFNLVWTGDVLTSIDMSPEQAKLFIKVIPSKNTITGDNVDSSTITFEMWKADETGIDTSFGSTIDIPMCINGVTSNLSCAFSSGTYDYVFKTDTAGNAQFCAYKPDGYRVIQTNNNVKVT